MATIAEQIAAKQAEIAAVAERTRAAYHAWQDLDQAHNALCEELRELKRRQREGGQ